MKKKKLSRGKRLRLQWLEKGGRGWKVLEGVARDGKYTSRELIAGYIS